MIVLRDLALDDIDAQGRQQGALGTEQARRGWGVSNIAAENANGPLRLVGSGEGLQLPDGCEGERIEAGATLRNMQG